MGEITVVLKRLPLYLLLLLGLGIGPVHALTIEITGGQEGALPIAIVPFGFDGVGSVPTDIAGIVAADLRRSGRFAPLAEKDIIAQPHAGAEVHFEDWRLLGTESLVVGLVQSSGAGYTIQFELFDVFKGTRLTGFSFTSGPNKNLRRVAHQIADIVYKQLTGEYGAFDTRIAYVAAGPNRGRYNNSYTLQVADADGYNPQTILTSKEPLLSPAWSPEGTRLAYVSFENRHSAIYVQDLRTGRREAVASNPGTNSAPAWSPDGRRLAVSLSRDGNPEIYILDLTSRSLQRVTNNTAIDTEPAWSPDGSTLVFTSDRGGSPQLYRVSANGGREERITFEGSYNARAQFSPDGRRLALVHGNGSMNHIAILELEGGALREITRTNLDESPSFSPNGTMVIYASEEGGRGILRVASVDGRTPQRLGTQENDVREPAWGPLNKRLEE
ncbi:Tol-Pal system periplasmic protein TolB [Gammaproteobacteria bacterium]